MKKFLEENRQFIFLIASWIIASIIAKELAWAVVVITFLALKRKDRYVELVVAFCCLLFFSDNRHHEFSFAQQVKNVVLLLMSGYVLLNKRDFPKQSTFYYPFAPFLFFAFVLFYKHPDPSISFQKGLSYCLMFIVIPTYFTKLLEENAVTFLRMLVMFFTFLLLIALTEIVWNNQDVFLVGRYNGLLGNPNGIGTYCTLFAIVIALAMYHYPGIFTKGELRLIIAVVGLSVILAQSRNAIFSIGIFLFFKKFYKISYWYGFVIVIISTILFQLVSQYLPDIILSLGLGDYMRVEHLDDGSGRLVAWDFGWKEIQRNILFGRGFAYEEYYFYANQEYLSDLGHQGGIHNTYLAIWMNTGIVGLLLFMYGLLRSIFQASSHCYLAFPALFAILFSISFEAWLIGSLNPFTILAILSITLLHFKPNKDEPQEENSVPVL